MSSDGNITAYFGSQSAATTCPDSTSCTVVVPEAPPGAGPVQVTIVTAAGRSNPVAFTYD